jgi:hypothetical protein
VRALPVPGGGHESIQRLLKVAGVSRVLALLLLKGGLPQNRIREVIRGVERAAAEIDKTWDALWIVTDGQTVFVVDGDEGRDATTGQMASLILLGLLDREARKLCQSEGRKKRAA